MDFKEIFDVVYANLRAKELARGGEELLRLRAHEKLQAFVVAGIATKNERKYKGVPKMLREFVKTAAEYESKLAAFKIACKGTKTNLPFKVVEAAKTKTVKTR